MFCIIFAIITMGIWWTAVYSCHHYIIDVILGIATAIAGVLLFEKVLMRNRKLQTLTDSYAAYISYYKE